MAKQSSQNFGGIWTKEKLEIINDYLNAYTIALKDQPFGKIYIDAFAGTGEVETRIGTLEGSVKIALSLPEKFDKYYFTETNSNKVKELKRLVHEMYPFLEHRVDIIQGDANKEVTQIIERIDWKKNRGLIFLDPYATSLKWSTLEAIARTRAIDVWYLFPYFVVNRLLTKSGIIDEKWENCLNTVLGSTDWKDEFYKQNQQITLFENSENDYLIKDASLDTIKEYLVKRLNSIFPAVAMNPYVLEDDSGRPLFILCFAVSNDKPKAQGLALKLANYVLDPRNRYKVNE